MCRLRKCPTNRGQIRLVHEALAEGLADILDKPVDPAELVATVKRLVQEDRGDRPESSCSTRPGVVRGLR
jgi:FixJ family two-component response regulator